MKFAGVFGIALQIVLCTHAILYLLTTKLSVKFAGAGRNICSTEVMNGPNHKRQIQLNRNPHILSANKPKTVPRFNFKAISSIISPALSG